jgi:hypothetical protein
MKSAKRTWRATFLLGMGLAVLAATVFLALRSLGTVVEPVMGTEPSSEEVSLGNQALREGIDEAPGRTPAPQSTDSKEPQPEGRVIELKIVDRDGAPVQGSRVSVAVGGQVFEGNGDAKGVYSFTLMPGKRSQMKVAVDAEGFVHVRRRFFSAGSIKIRLTRVASLQAVLIDRLGHAPMAGIRVRYKHYLCRACDPEIATSDARGFFELAHLPRGVALHLEISGEGIPIQFADVVIPRDVESHREQIEVRRGLVLRGVLVDHTLGTGIQGVPICVSPPGDLVLGETDESGRFSIRVLPSPLTQEIKLWIKAKGYCQLRSSFGASDLQGVTELRIPLPRTSSLHGVMLDTEGNPLQGGVVYVNPNSDKKRSPHAGPDPSLAFEDLRKHWTLHSAKSILSAKTDEQGRFSTGGLVPFHRDYYNLNVWCKGYRSADVLVPETAAPGAPTKIEIRLESVGPTARLHGRVTLNGQPHSARLDWKGKSRAAPISIDDDGCYDSEVEAGELHLDCKLYGPRGGSPIAEAARKVQVSARGELRVDFAITQSMGVICGKVRKEGGEPVARKRLRIECKKSGWILAVTDKEGRYSVEVPGDAAPYIITLYHGSVPNVRRIMQPGQAEVDFVLPVLADFRFRLFDAQSGDSIPTLRLYLRKTGEKSWKHIPRAWSLPDENGYREMRVPGGTYDVRMTSVRTGHAPAEATGVVVTARAKPRGCELPMRPGATLRFVLAKGQTALPQGLPLALVEASAPNQIRSVRGADQGWKVQADAGLHTHFVAQRLFLPGIMKRDRVRRLAPGLYLIKSLTPGVEVLPREILVTEGESRTISVTWKALVPAKSPGEVKRE